MAARNALGILETKGFACLVIGADAAVKSARLRFRPILMTAFSFILGVMPLVIASGAGAEARVVMGMALLGGMTLATVLGVFFYPMLYIFIGKVGRYEKKRSLQQQNIENLE
jgi:HAE1 family hydrophobic/amphiphilic exporter-1